MVLDIILGKCRLDLFQNTYFKYFLFSSTLLPTFGATNALQFVINLFFDNGDHVIFEEITYGRAAQFARLYSMNIHSGKFYFFHTHRKMSGVTSFFVGPGTPLHAMPIGSHLSFYDGICIIWDIAY